MGINSGKTIKKKSYKYIRYLLVVIITAGMVAVAELAGQMEIIFPEIAAVAVGTLASPKQSWQTSRPRMVLLICVCALLGVFIVRFMNTDIWLQVSFAFLVCQVIYLFSGTGFAPMISAAALPVLLQTSTWIYPASAAVLTAGVALIQAAVEKLGIKKREPYIKTSLPDRRDLGDALVRTGILAAGAFCVVGAGVKFCIAPPLLVAFTELSRNKSAGKIFMFKRVVLVILCAAGGCLSRIIISERAQLPLWLAAAAAAVIFIFFMRILNVWMPPAGALAILPMLIPAQQARLYVPQVAAGITVIVIITYFLFRNGHCRVFSRNNDR